ERDEHAGRAEAALQAMLVTKRLLERMQHALRRRQALHRFHARAVRLDSQHEAAARAHAVDQDGACAAHPMFAADMRAGEVERVPQKICKRGACNRLPTASLAVDLHLDLVNFHASRLPARANASSRLLRNMERATLRRYS